MKLFRHMSILMPVILFVYATCHAFDIQSSRQQALADAVLISDPSASEIARFPTLTPQSTWEFEFGAARQFELSDLETVSLAVAHRFKDFTVSGAFNRFGNADLYAENTIQFSAGYRFTYFTLGGMFGYRQYLFGRGYSNLNAVSVGIAAGGNIGDLHIHASVDRLNRPRPIAGAPRENVTARVVTQLVTSRRLNVIGTLMAEEDHRPRWGLAQALEVAGPLNLFWSLRTGPMEYGAGFELRGFDFSVIYSGAYHSDLGYSQNLSLGYHLGTPTEEPRSKKRTRNVRIQPQ